MDKSILISIITPAYCEKSKVYGFVESLINQEACDLSVIELVLVNDSSPYAWCAKDLEVLTQNSGLGSVLLIDNASNQGRSKSRNIGMKHAKGRIFFFLDVDNYLCNDACRNLLNDLPDNHMSRINIRMHAPGVGYQRYFDNRYLGARGMASGERLSSRYCASDGLIIPKTIMQRLSGFDEDFSYYGCEDEELGVRAEYAEIPLVFLANVRAVDTDSPTLVRAAERMVEYSAKSFPLFCEKHPRKKEHGLFPFAEKYLIKRTNLLRCAPLTTLISLLSLIESLMVNVSVQPPNFLYKLVLGAAYLKGGRDR